tara:strand:+ start:551 stop:700 length:150 start_codon:yes stop_codon:yes gene_type:complete
MTCVGEMFGALQDLALSRAPNYDDAVVTELKYMLVAYYKARARRRRGSR